MKKVILSIILLLNLFDISYAQFEKDYEFIDTLSIESSKILYRIEADTIFTNKNYGCTIKVYIKVYNQHTNKLVQEIKDTTEMGCFSYDIYLEDINLDGNKDIVLDEGPYNLSSTYAILLFNEKSQSYLSPIYFNDYYIDVEKHTLTSSFQQLNARGGSSEKYLIVNGDFILIETESISNDNFYGQFEKKIFINETLNKRIIGNYFIDMNVKHDASKKDSATIEFYSTFNDSLVIKSKYWSELETEDPSYFEENDTLYYCDQEWGCYKYYFKEEYNYTFTNKVKVDTVSFELKDNVWQQLK